MRKEIKYIDKGSLDDFSGNYEHFEQEFSNFFKEYSKSIFFFWFVFNDDKNLKILDEAYYKAVLQGYFNTTNQIWMNIINVANNSNKTSKKKLKSENKQIEKMSYLKNKWTSLKQKGSESL